MQLCWSAGSMIGSGIFIVSADVSRNFREQWLVIGCLVFSRRINADSRIKLWRISRNVPKAGGQYIYLQKAYNPLIAFLYGWTLFAVIQAGTIAAVAVTFAKFSSYFFSWFGEDNILFEIGKWKIKGSQILAVVSIWVLTLINLGV